MPTSSFGIVSELLLDHKFESFVSKEEVENEIYVFSWTCGLRLGVRYPQRAVGRRASGR
jgi:hypothetical protein